MSTGKLKVLHEHVGHQPSMDQLEFLSIYANETVYGTPRSSTEVFENIVADESKRRFTVIRSQTMFVNGVRYHPYSSLFGYMNFFDQTEDVVEGASSPFDFCIYDEIERELQLWVKTKKETGEVSDSETFPEIFTLKISEIENLCDEELVVEPMNKLEELRVDLSKGSGWAEKYSENERYLFLDHLVLRESLQRLRWKYPRVKNVVGLVAQMDSGSDTSWVHESVGEVDTWTKVENDGSLSVRCRSVQDQALFNAISLIYEIDLHPQFMPHLAKSIKLHHIMGCGQRANLLLRYIYKLPMPFTNRDIVLFAFGCNAIELEGVNGIIIAAQSIPAGQTSWWGKPVPEDGADKTVRETVRGMNFVMKPLPGGKTELTVISNLDKQVAFIPKSVVNWMIKDMIKGLYRNMIKLNKKFTETEFAKRVQINPEFYNWVKQNIVKHNVAY